MSGREEAGRLSGFWGVSAAAGSDRGDKSRELPAVAKLITNLFPLSIQVSKYPIEMDAIRLQMASARYPNKNIDCSKYFSKLAHETIVECQSSTDLG